MSKLIVIEGACDGMGKSTQSEILCERLTKEGEQVIKHHFPSYNTYQASPVEHYLKGELGNTSELSPYLINSLYAIDRAITWSTFLKAEYLKGKNIILDRYTTSSLIYQSALITDITQKKDFINYVIDYEYVKLGIKEPDNVIFLHAPFDLVTKIRNARKTNDGIINDIHEADIEYMKKVYDNAHFIADYLSWNKIDCSHNNELRSIDDISESIYKLVKKR